MTQRGEDIHTPTPTHLHYFGFDKVDAIKNHSFEIRFKIGSNSVLFVRQPKFLNSEINKLGIDKMGWKWKRRLKCEDQECF